MEKEDKMNLYRVIICAVILFMSFIPLIFHIDLPEWVLPALCVFDFVLISYDIIIDALKNVFKGEIFDENLLMSVASVAAVLIGEYREAVAIILFFKIGELFEDAAVDKSNKSIESLLNIRPDSAVVLRDGKEEKVSPENVMKGETVIVRPGEKIPLDGTVIDGFSSLDMSALTGESVPKDVNVGDSVLNGTINLTGLLSIRTSGTFSESTVSKILEIVKNSENGKAKSERFITRFSKIYTPAVVICALLLAVIPSIITVQLSEWIYRGIVFLVVSCPCALVVSVPLGFFGGIGAASENGILIKGANYIDILSEIDTVVFDKTGTLTKGEFTVTDIHPDKISEDELMDIASHAESFSNHPISRSVCDSFNGVIDKSRITSIENLNGLGIKAVVDGKEIFAGNEKLMSEHKIKIADCNHVGTVIHVSVDGVYAGHIVISDKIKETSAETVKELYSCGIKNTVLLTGDKESVAHDVSSKLGISSYYSELLPVDKVEKVKELTAEKHTVAFVGDGINDAPVIKQADLGIAMGALGSDAAIEAADIVLTDDNPIKIVQAIKIARKTLSVVKINIVFALAVKILILVLGAFGLANMWLAVFADVGVTLLAILNSLRTLYFSK